MNSEGSESNSSSVNTASNRLKKELMDLMMSFEKGISAFPQEDSIFRWIATIDGPKDSVYENLKFKLSLKFPQNYPYTPPTIRFMTCCFHPNIDSDGVICLDILKDKWTASYDIRSILLSIQSLLNEPNLDSPLDLSAAALWGRPNFKQVMLKNYNSSDSSKSSKN